MNTKATATLNKGAEKLASFLIRMRWTPRKLARQLDCDHSSVIQWREGRVLPSLRRALDLEREAGVDPHDWVVPVNDNHVPTFTCGRCGTKDKE